MADMNRGTRCVEHMRHLSVGGPGSGSCHITRKRMVRRYQPDQLLVSRAERIALARPDLGAYGKVMGAGNTEAAIGVKHRLRSLAFVNLTPGGALPNWHQRADTVENVDPAVLVRTEAFMWRC